MIMLLLWSLFSYLRKCYLFEMVSPVFLFAFFNPIRYSPMSYLILPFHSLPFFNSLSVFVFILLFFFFTLYDMLLFLLPLLWFSPCLYVFLILLFSFPLFRYMFISIDVWFGYFISTLWQVLTLVPLNPTNQTIPCLCISMSSIQTSFLFPILSCAWHSLVNPHPYIIKSNQTKILMHE